MTEGPQLLLPVIPGPALVAGPVFVCFEIEPLPRRVKRGKPAKPPTIPFKKRHRTRIIYSKGKAFTSEYPDPECAEWEAIIREVAESFMLGRPPTTRPVALLVHAFKPVPESWSKRERELALLGAILPTSKPDWDNHGKITDALNKVVWIDDGQVTDGRVIKRYSARPGLRIEVREMVDPEGCSPLRYEHPDQGGVDGDGDDDGPTDRDDEIEGGDAAAVEFEHGAAPALEEP